MSANILLIALGGLLVFTAVLGGGFELRELKIPRIGGGTRILAGIIGAIVLTAGIAMPESSPGTKDGNTPPDNAPPSSHQIQFIVLDQLEPDQIASGQSEQSLIRIDGKVVGNLTVNGHFPKSELLVIVPKEGQHSFAIEAKAVLRIDDQLADVNCYGTGMIDVRTKSRFVLEARYDENGPCLAWLEER